MKVPVTLAPGRQRSSRSRLRLWAGGSFTLSSSFFSGPLGSSEGGINYDAVVSAVSQPVTGQEIMSVVFVLEWA